uniref:Uncharacterized protein n=1 Tax=Glossina morsitans morsitans TaxID=37546 RepID=A0A1B0GD85_GLOMM
MKSKDMQKFSLRMKGNDLIVTELYKDPNSDPITATSVHLTPKTSSSCGNWIEIAYGTKSGIICIIVQHPETAGHGPCLFKTFSVHQSPVTKVMFTHSESSRFRGMLSTQPDSTPEASFKIVSPEATDSNYSYAAGNDFDPYGDYDEQTFVQKVVSETNQLCLRLASNGDRVCMDGCVHECEVSSRIGSRFILTGHCNGNIQMWELTTALAFFPKTDTNELLRLFDQCEISHSLCSTPCMSPCVSVLGKMANTRVARMKTSNLALLNQSF